jgi:HSP20 family molecular chaperone IbpA
VIVVAGATFRDVWVKDEIDGRLVVGGRVRRERKESEEQVLRRSRRQRSGERTAQPEKRVGVRGKLSTEGGGRGSAWGRLDFVGWRA